VQRRASPDLGTQQTTDAQFEADREQENRDADFGNTLECGCRAEPGGVQAKTGKQKSDQRRQPQEANAEPENEGGGN
jgi:hypothetical protein